MLALPAASIDDIEHYRTYLATRNPIVEIETRFLDPGADLVCLAKPDTSPPPAGSSRFPSTTTTTTTTTSSSSSSFPSASETSDDSLLTPVPHRRRTFGNPTATAGVGGGHASLTRNTATTGTSHTRSSSLGLPISPRPPQQTHPAAHTHSSSFSGLPVSPRPLPQQQRPTCSSTPRGPPTDDEQTTPPPRIPPEQAAAVLASLAALLPVLAFPLVADFAGRMAVVLIVGLAVAAAWRWLAEEDGPGRALIDWSMGRGGERIGIESGSGRGSGCWGWGKVYAGVMVVLAAAVFWIVDWNRVGLAK